MGKKKTTEDKNLDLKIDFEIDDTGAHFANARSVACVRTRAFHSRRTPPCLTRVLCKFIG